MDGKDAESVFRDVRAEYQMFMGSGSIQAKEFAFTSKAGDLFMKWSGLASTEMLDPESLSIIKKYENSWLSLTEEDMMASLSGASEDEIMTNKLSQAMTKMTLSDIESYLTEYPIWKETKDLGTTGELHSYEVTLHKENMIAMAKAFVKKSTQKDMTPDALSSLEQSLAKIDVKGRISYDPKNPKVAEFDGLVVSREGTGTTVAVKSSESEKGFSLSVKAPSNTLVMNYTKEASMNTLLFSLTE